MDVKDVNLIKYISCIVIDSHLGSLESTVKDMEEEVLDSYKIFEMLEMKMYRKVAGLANLGPGWPGV